MVSIDRAQVEGQQQKLVPGSGMRVKKRRRPDTKDSPVKDVAGKKMTVRVSLSKLKGEFGRRPQPIETSAAMMLGFEEDLGLEESFTLAAGVPDQVVPLNEYPGENMCLFNLSLVVVVSLVPRLPPAQQRIRLPPQPCTEMNQAPPSALHSNESGSPLSPA